MVPLLQVISRGSPMSFEDSNRIIPLFYLFSSLFSHSLISIHDNEFFGDPMEGGKKFFLFKKKNNYVFFMNIHFELLLYIKV